MNQVQYRVNGVAEAVRPIILSRLFIDRSRFEDSRIRFFGDAYTRIAFSVFEQYVVMRLVLLDEVVFQQECVLFALYNHITYICYMSNQLAGLGRLMVFIEIAVNPPVQVLRFPYIDNLPFFVKVLVHTRTLRNALQQ